jgi:hypothetical protein
LLRGDAGAQILSDCDSAATSIFVPDESIFLRVMGTPLQLYAASTKATSGFNPRRKVIGLPRALPGQKETIGGQMSADDLMDNFPAAPNRLVTLSNWRKAPFSPGLSQCPPADPDRQHRGLGPCGGARNVAGRDRTHRLRRTWIYIHPKAELVIIRMASEATPLDRDRDRGWRRGFDAIAEYFL